MFTNILKKEKKIQNIYLTITLKIKSDKHLIFPVTTNILVMSAVVRRAEMRTARNIFILRYSPCVCEVKASFPLSPPAWPCQTCSWLPPSLSPWWTPSPAPGHWATLSWLAGCMEGPVWKRSGTWNYLGTHHVQSRYTTFCGLIWAKNFTLANNMKQWKAV